MDKDIRRILDFINNNPGGDIPDANREDLAKLFGALNFKEGVEVGTETGVYAKCLCLHNIGLHLHCVDPWLAYPSYRDHLSQEKMDFLYKEAQVRLAPFHVDLIRRTSEAAHEYFANESLDFVYIDGNHALKYVVADLVNWYPKVKVGGIISGHDFIKRKVPDALHVIEGIAAYRDAYKITDPLFAIGRKADLPEEKRDRPRSWLWVKGGHLEQL